MTLTELQLMSNQTVDNAVVPMDSNPDYMDRSDVLFSYMNMVAYNNKVDLKLN